MYEKRKESILEKISLIESAEQKGIEKGKKEGENRKTIEIAKKLIVNGLDDELIKNSTGLSIEEINILRNEK